MLNQWFKSLFLAGMLCLASVTEAAGLLTPKDGSLPALEIRSHAVNVVIEDGYAITGIEQTFHNPHGRDLEAVYAFPVPEKAAVSEFTLWIDGKPITGEVLERQQAREVYEQEKAAGREAGVTEKNGYKTFEVSVSPVRAGQDTRIRLGYIQPAHVDTGMGRYVYPLEEGGVDEEQLAFWTAVEEVKERFSFKLILRSAYPVEAVRLPDYPQAGIQQIGPGEWQVSIERGANSVEEGAQPANATSVFSLNKDIVLYWRHAANLPGSVDLLTHKPDAGQRGTFMLTLTPGDDLQLISEGRDWVFVLDLSGSMSGKYATLAAGVEQALGKLNPRDRFRIVMFNIPQKTQIQCFRLAQSGRKQL